MQPPSLNQTVEPDDRTRLRIRARGASRWWDPVEVEARIEQLTAVLDHMVESEESLAGDMKAVGDEFRESALNLVRYLSLRNYDMRELQEYLTGLGLSSLGRSEADVKATVCAVIRILGRLVDREYEPPQCVDACNIRNGRELLDRHTNGLLGPVPKNRAVRIMVTLPGEAADDYSLVRDLIVAGMDCARINCAHDGAPRWAAMVDHIERARGETEQPCRILMDLAGIKLRTGPVTPGPEVVRLRPEKDKRGRVIAAAQVWLAPLGVRPPSNLENTDASKEDGVPPAIPVSRSWVESLNPGDLIRFRDTRGKKRDLTVVAREQEGCWAEAGKSAYISTGTVLKLRRKGVRGKYGRSTTVVGPLPAVEGFIRLYEGDVLRIDQDPIQGSNATYEADGRRVSPARVSCTLPFPLTSLRVGETVRLNDGKIEGVIRSVSAESLRVEITRARKKGSRLRSHKSINLPDSQLPLAGLTEKDREDLDFVVRHADLVGFSFINNPEDVLTLQGELAARDAAHLGIVLKIETKRAFQRLPALLLAAMRNYPVGVMIARGDLAVECGWERMAEVQEEILWICEAAHVPVIWATQVLESLAQTGLPSRAEITDAAMGERAECVMLNKGPFILQAIKTLDDVLRRMQNHQVKKTALLRRLRVSEMFDRPPQIDAV